MKNVLNLIFNNMFQLHELRNDLPFLSEKRKIEKVEKLAANLHNKTEYIIPKRNVKQALNHGLISKKVHRVIKFNQKVWLKSYNEMNTELRQKAKNNFQKDFFKLMNTAVFGKTMEIMRKQRDIKPVKAEKRRNYLVQNQIIILQNFSQKFISNRNGKNSNIYE